MASLSCGHAGTRPSPRALWQQRQQQSGQNLWPLPHSKAASLDRIVSKQIGHSNSGASPPSVIRPLDGQLRHVAFIHGALLAAVKKRTALNGVNSDKTHAINSSLAAPRRAAWWWCCPSARRRRLTTHARHEPQLQLHGPLPRPELDPRPPLQAVFGIHCLFCLCGALAAAAMRVEAEAR